MRLLIGVSLLALLSGCGGDDADGVFVSASWSFREVELNTPTACPDGFGTALLHVSAVDASPCNQRGDTLCSEPLECAAGMGTSAALVPGVYEVWIDITTGIEGGPVYASTTPATLDLTQSDKSYARQIFTDGGVFRFAWRLRATDNSLRTCEQAGVTGITIGAVNEADPAGAANDEIKCDDSQGYSFAYVAGSYQVTIEAVDENGQLRGEADLLTGQTIVAPNGVTDLGTIDIPLRNLPL